MSQHETNPAPSGLCRTKVRAKVQGHRGGDAVWSSVCDVAFSV